jgi:hypothetical protein
VVFGINCDGEWDVLGLWAGAGGERAYQPIVCQRWRPENHIAVSRDRRYVPSQPSGRTTTSTCHDLPVDVVDSPHDASAANQPA